MEKLDRRAPGDASDTGPYRSASPAPEKSTKSRSRRRKKDPNKIPTADASVMVNFEETVKEEDVPKTDMTSDDLLMALQYYGKVNKDFLHDVLVKHFTENDLEELTAGLLQQERDNARLAQQYVSHGSLTFEELNQRFLGVPASYKKNLPKEEFKSDNFPYKLPRTSTSTAEPDPLEERPERDSLDPTKSRPSSATTAKLSLKGKKRKLTRKEYLRIGDVRGCPSELLRMEKAYESSPQNRKIIFKQSETTEVEKKPLSREAALDDPRVTESMVQHPTTGLVFETPPTRKTPRTTSVPTPIAVCDPNTPRLFYPDCSDFSVLYDFVQSYAESIWADEAAMYVMGPNGKTMWKLSEHGSARTVDMDASVLRKCSVHNHIDHDLRHTMLTEQDRDAVVKHAMLIPVKDREGVIRCIVEFIRTHNFPAPFPEDLFHQAIDDVTKLSHFILKGSEFRREINTYRVLGKRFPSLFTKPKNLDHIIYRFMVLIKTQLNPARVHMFRISYDRTEAVASMYDTGRCSKKGHHFDYSKEVKLFVSSTFLREFIKQKRAFNVKTFENAWIAGETLDALLPGPKIQNFLAVPFTNNWEGKMCEFVFLVNSAGTSGFTQTEIHILNSLLTFWLSAVGGLYYRYRIAASAKPLKTEGDMFARLSIESPADVDEILEICGKDVEAPPDFYTHDFYCKSYLDDNFVLLRLFVVMMEDLFGRNAFHRRKMACFVIAVREGYRSVRYHGWHHGFNVAHAMYIVLRDNREVFSILERKALMIATVCHDLDHLGYNNAFAKKFISPLERLYPTSQMENHHIRETFRILALTDCDIIGDWPVDDKVEMASLIKDLILATDLALYFAGKKTVEGYVDVGLNLEIPVHRRRLMHLMMNACDLTASTKPWETQTEVAMDLYDEFYSQGDTEKRYGEPPIPMLDRDNADNMAKEQVGFIRYVCMPLYIILLKVFPSTQILVDNLVNNLQHWEVEAVKAEEAKAARLVEGAVAGANAEIDADRAVSPVRSGHRFKKKSRRGKGPHGGKSELDVGKSDKHGGKSPRGGKSQKGQSRSPRSGAVSPL